MRKQDKIIINSKCREDWAVVDIEDIKSVYTIPVEDMEKWEHHHKKFDEHIALIKQMLMI